MKRPPPGLCLPCELDHVRDGDTVVVRVLGGAYQWAIRLIDCWAPEMCTAEGKVSKQYAIDYLSRCCGLHVWIPAPSNMQNLLKNITFDRLPGHVFVSEHRTLSEVMVYSGHATATKQGA